MVFSSLLFIFLFLPVLLFVYYCVSGLRYRWRNVVLVLASLLFYVWGAPKSEFLPLFLMSIVFDYFLARQVERVVAIQHKRYWVALSVTVNLGFLAYYKYANFFIGEVNRLFAAAGLPSWQWLQVVLPIGISFFVFHKISYVLDIYRGKAKALTNILDFALYLLLFPQLIAGPIVRFHEIEDQLFSRRSSLNLFYEGIWRFSLGLAKKVLIANTLGGVVDQIYKLSPVELTSDVAWLGALLYAFQIYFDFSGYSDMAIGLGHMFGFRLPENFNRPYVALTITEFWRRWHMSLSRFFKDYLYIPLGGNRCSQWRNYLNLWIVFLLCGLWHGANWGFIVWGAFHGFLLTLDKMFLLRWLQRLPHWVSGGITFLLVVIGWVFFRSDNIAHAVHYLQVMFVWQQGFAISPFIHELVNHKVLVYTVIAAVFSFIDFSRFNFPAVSNLNRFVKGWLALFLLFYCSTVLSTGSFNPFIYFQF